MARLAPAQAVVLPGLFIVGLLSEAMLNDCGVPEQPFAMGITTTVALPALVVLKLILPLPVAANPMAGFEFVQLKVAPEVPEKFTVTDCPTQAVTSAGSVIEGAGLTVMVKVRGWPLQPNSVGVTVMVATRGVKPVFVAEKLMFPAPLAAKPMAGLEFVQLNRAPFVPLKPTEITKPAHTAWSMGCVMVGAAFTVRKTGVRVALVQPVEISRLSA